MSGKRLGPRRGQMVSNREVADVESLFEDKTLLADLGKNCATKDNGVARDLTVAFRGARRARRHHPDAQR